MFLNYDELKAALVEKGVDPKVLDMPAIKERIQFKDIPLEDFKVNPDGTFNLGNLVMQKTKRTEEIKTWVYHEEEFDGMDASYSSEETKEIERDIITMVECSEVETKKNAALDSPFWLDDDYEPTMKELMAKLTILDMDGIEIETQEFRNTPFIQERMKKGTADYSIFTDRPDLVEEKHYRSPGKIIRSEKRGDKEYKWEFYDNGRWSLSLDGDASFGTDIGDMPARAIDRFSINARRVVSRYPELKEVMARRREELMETIDERTTKTFSRNLTLEENNKKLLSMLQKALDFAETVRSSGIGRIFFGRKAKEVLGDKAKNLEKLAEGREKED